MIIEPIDYRPMSYGKSTYAMEAAVINVKLGKRVLFYFVNLERLRNGISILHHHFPTALFEVVGTTGLIVWQRKPK